MENSLWAISIGVRPEYRRLGIGTALASMATSDIIAKGHIVTWSTEADNLASYKIAQALGYQNVICHIRNPVLALDLHST